jgi:hypothetical protein
MGASTEFCSESWDLALSFILSAGDRKPQQTKFIMSTIVSVFRAAGGSLGPMLARANSSYAVGEVYNLLALVSPSYHDHCTHLEPFHTRSEAWIS